MLMFFIHRRRIAADLYFDRLVFSGDKP